MPTWRATRQRTPQGRSPPPSPRLAHRQGRRGRGCRGAGSPALGQRRWARTSSVHILQHGGAGRLRATISLTLRCNGAHLRNSGRQPYLFFLNC